MAVFLLVSLEHYQKRVPSKTNTHTHTICGWEALSLSSSKLFDGELPPNMLQIYPQVNDVLQSSTGSPMYNCPFISAKSYTHVFRTAFVQPKGPSKVDRGHRLAADPSVPLRAALLCRQAARSKVGLVGCCWLELVLVGFGEIWFPLVRSVRRSLGWSVGWLVGRFVGRSVG